MPSIIKRGQIFSSYSAHSFFLEGLSIIVELSNF